jgi:sigma-B regulation protein RsbU (phosphoserine phosphatase)
LARGDRLVLYTDGLTDALSPGGRPYGRERLRALLRDAAAQSAEALCDLLFAELAAHQGESTQFDDMTALIIAVE